jgi:hypothetical protein
MNTKSFLYVGLQWRSQEFMTHRRFPSGVILKSGPQLEPDGFFPSSPVRPDSKVVRLKSGRFIFGVKLAKIRLVHFWRQSDKNPVSSGRMNFSPGPAGPVPTLEWAVGLQFFKFIAIIKPMFIEGKRVTHNVYEFFIPKLWESCYLLVEY